MKTTKKTKRGIIAVSTLYISIILLILIVALLVSLRAESGHVLRYNYTTEALYMAEAGFADATRQITANNSWAPTEPDKIVYDFPGNKGRYTIVFDDGTDDVEEYESVNNLTNPLPTDGPRGPGTVPARTVDLVVTVEHRGRLLRYEALISRGFAEPITVPLLTTGRIKLEGGVEVNGIVSATDHTTVEVGIHSNNKDNEADIITWDPIEADEDAYINGVVSATSDNAGAITAHATGSNEFNVKDVEVGRAPMPFPVIDVETAVRFGKSSPPILVNTHGGNTGVSTGKHSYPGGVINGDLVLNGGELYINGDLEVNGTIKGHGSIHVNGNTSFRGDSVLKMDSTQSLALFSKGNVKLSGFDGTAFLEGVARDNPTTFGVWYQESKEAHAALVAATSGTHGTDWGNGNVAVEEWRNVIAGTGATPVKVPAVLDPALDPADPAAVITPAEYYTNDSFEKMITFLQTPPVGESAKFVVRRLKQTRDPYLDGGILQTANNSAVPTGAAEVAEALENQDFDKLGTSFFEGVVYSNGAVYASNDVHIVGALLAKGPNGVNRVPGTGWRPAGTDPTDPELWKGDVYLGAYSKLIYNQALLENPFVGTNTGPVLVTCWLGLTE